MIEMDEIKSRHKQETMDHLIKMTVTGVSGNRDSARDSQRNWSVGKEDLS